MGNTEDLIKKLVQAIEQEDNTEPYVFDKEEVKDLQYLLLILQRARTLGWFGKYLLGILVVIGLILSNLERIMKWFT